MTYNGHMSSCLNTNEKFIQTQHASLVACEKHTSSVKKKNSKLHCCLLFTQAAALEKKDANKTSRVRVRVCTFSFNDFS